MHKIMKIGLIIGITIAFLTPVSLVIADDIEPPVIASVIYGPHAGVRTDPGFFLYQSCLVTDNVSVADVKINITGPIGFTPVNSSMTNTGGANYTYQVDNITLSGTYTFFIWAIDPSNNTAQTGLYHMLVFDNYISYIHVDGNNTMGPWNGTEEYPLQFISDALAVLAENGTILLHEGLYQNPTISLEKNMVFLGENQQTTLIDGAGLNAIEIVGNHTVTISQLTIQNATIGLSLYNGTNITITQCTFTDCLITGIDISEYHHLLVTDCSFNDNIKAIRLTNATDNQFYHNNFINNLVHVSCYFNTSFNQWDNGITGNYWDNYRLLYPSADIDPSTGTWDTAYVVNASGVNIDNHPWVYPSGYIDTIPPQVTVLYPNGGETLYKEITIQWTASDDQTSDLDGSILLEYSSDNGASWNTIASQLNNTGSYLWNTSLVPDGVSYLVAVTAIDEFYNVGTDRSDAVFTINNFALETPDITGPSQGGNGIPFTFTAVAYHPSGEQIYYIWDWGDGNVSEWFGPYNSSVPMTITYTWANDGIYDVRVKARYSGGSESNWSAVHPMVIAEQINFSNVKLGTIYFKLFSFNHSFIFSDFLRRLGVVFIFTTHEMELQAYATDVVKKVDFLAENQMKIETGQFTDEDGSDGFSCVLNVTRGAYILNITAYDANGTLIDKYSLYTVFFIRMGRYATGLGGEGRLLRLQDTPRIRH